MWVASFLFLWCLALPCFCICPTGRDRTPYSVQYTGHMWVDADLLEDPVPEVGLLRQRESMFKSFQQVFLHLPRGESHGQRPFPTGWTEGPPVPSPPAPAAPCTWAQLVLSHTLPVQGILEMEKSKEKGDGWVPFQFPWEEHLLWDAGISSFLSVSVSLRSKAFHLPREHCNRARISLDLNSCLGRNMT